MSRLREARYNLARFDVSSALSYIPPQPPRARVKNTKSIYLRLLSFLLRIMKAINFPLPHRSRARKQPSSTTFVVIIKPRLLPQRFLSSAFPQYTFFFCSKEKGGVYKITRNAGFIFLAVCVCRLNSRIRERAKDTESGGGKWRGEHLGVLLLQTLFVFLLRVQALRREAPNLRV